MARFAKPLQGPFSPVAKHPQKHKNRPKIGRFSHFNPSAEMHPFSPFSASKAPEKWLCDAICRKKQLFAGSFVSRSHSFCSFTFGRDVLRVDEQRDDLSVVFHIVVPFGGRGRRRPSLFCYSLLYTFFGQMYNSDKMGRRLESCRALWYDNACEQQRRCPQGMVYPAGGAFFAAGYSKEYEDKGK